ncbi:MAG: bifunctional sugar-1-phosphate nucleotidylyltransferase/acetyltransferase [Candidatus Thorarchaeota archaeon]|jgi:bifunctional UDP-N-acetylglucosamine pyrophosphorylase/glucosamine-1-phosphate N-acetyltransferase
MKALVLTAGQGNRLRPIASRRSKAMLKIAGKPVMEYIIESLKANGINDIVVVVGHGRDELIDHFQHGGNRGVQIRYVVQLEQKGVEDAILCARNEIENDEEFLLVNGDVLVESDMVSRTLNNHKTMEADITMLVTLVSNPEQFGTVKIGRNGVVEALVEKGGPDRYVSNYAVAGVSVFSTQVISLLEQHETMELTVEKLIEGKSKVAAAVWEKEWAEFTWPWDILKANRIILDRELSGKGSFISESADVHNSVVLEGPVFIDDDTTIRPGTTLRGPIHIGKGAYVGNNSLIRDYTSLCDGVHIGYAVEVRNSMIFDNVRLGRMTYLADSIVGANTCIEAGAQLWNWRPGTKPLFLANEKGPVEIPLKKFGAIIGDNVVIGVNSSIYPATRIGEDTLISPGCIIEDDVPPRSEVSVKQKLVISKRKDIDD